MNLDNDQWQTPLARKWVAEGKAEAVLTVLRLKGLDPDPAVRARIDACRDHDQLGRWLARALTASRLADVFDDSP